MTTGGSSGLCIHALYSSSTTAIDPLPQFPDDLPGEVSGSTATKLFFSQTQLNQIREIQRTVVGKTSGSDADHLAGVMKVLAPLTCVLHNKQHSPFARVKIKPYFAR